MFHSIAHDFVRPFPPPSPFMRCSSRLSTSVYGKGLWGIQPVWLEFLRFTIYKTILMKKSRMIYHKLCVNPLKKKTNIALSVD